MRRTRMSPGRCGPFDRRAFLPAILFAMVCGAASSASAAESDTVEPEEDFSLDLYARIGGAAAREVHRPASVAFAASARDLEREIDALCLAASPDALAASRDAFAGAVAAFSRMELLRVGPLMEDNRLNRLFYWPDTRRAGERQLRALLLDEAATTITAEAMSSRSVAVQGLPALERLLHGDAAEALAETSSESATTDGESGGETDGSTRCTVARAVAGNVRIIADEIEKDWSSEDGIVRQMSAPRSDDPLFRTSNEIIRSLLTQLETGVDVLVERKLGPGLAAEPPSRRGMPFRSSGLTAENLAGNIESLRALALVSGLARQAGLDKELGFELRVAAGHAERLVELQPDAPLPTTLGDEEGGVMRALSSAAASIGTTILERLSPTLGVRTGFNAQDGD